jgi:hypothetical protein
MVSTLESIQEQLFEEPKRKPGRNPSWNEIGALVSAPTEGPELIIGEYALSDDFDNVTHSQLGSHGHLYRVSRSRNSRSAAFPF